MSVYPSRFCYQGNTPQYPSQMELKLHKTFSVFQDWSPELINNVNEHAQALIHPQYM